MTDAPPPTQPRAAGDLPAVLLLLLLPVLLLGDCWGSVLAAVIALPLAGCVPVDGAVADWLQVAALGVFQMGLPYVLLMYAIGRVPALQASLLLAIEPALNL